MSKGVAISLIGAFALIAILFAFSANDNDGPVEQAGEQIDQAVDDIGDGLDDAADEIEDATN